MCLRRFGVFLRLALGLVGVVTASSGCQPLYETEYRVVPDAEMPSRQAAYDRVVARVGPICSARGLEKTEVTVAKAMRWAKTLPGTHIVLDVWVEDRDGVVVVLIGEYRSPRQTDEGRELREAVRSAIQSIPGVGLGAGKGATAQ